jgi:hypothetical protein
MTIPIRSTERVHNSNQIRLSTFRKTAVAQKKFVLVSLRLTREHGRHFST